MLCLQHHVPCLLRAVKGIDAPAVREASLKCCAARRELGSVSSGELANHVATAIRPQLLAR